MQTDPKPIRGEGSSAFNRRVSSAVFKKLPSCGPSGSSAMRTSWRSSNGPSPPSTSAAFCIAISVVTPSARFRCIGLPKTITPDVSPTELS